MARPSSQTNQDAAIADDAFERAVLSIYFHAPVMVLLMLSLGALGI